MSEVGTAGQPSQSALYAENGGEDGPRTRNLLRAKQLLVRLSFIPEMVNEAGVEPAYSGMSRRCCAS